MLPPDVLGEFASTFKEWHYFIGGVSLGFLLGWVGHAVSHAVLYGG